MHYVLKQTALLLAFSSCVAGAAFASAQPSPLAPWQDAAKKARVTFNLPQWEKTPAQIQATTETVISVGDARLDIIAGRKPEQMNFHNTIAALDYAYYPVVAASYRLNLIDETNTSKAVRDAAHEAIKRLQKWFVDTSFRQDVYQAVKSVAATKPAVSGEDAKYLKTVLRDFRRNGMELPEEKRRQLQDLKNKLNERQLAFQTNITKADTWVEFTREELEGASADFLSNKQLIGEDGRYRINANVTWQVLEILENVKSEESRQRLSIARSSRAMKENTPLFVEILKVRAQIAKLLGYDNWADYRIEIKMAGNGKTALDFLQDISTGLAPKFEQELATFTKLKAMETGNSNAQAKYWDIPYYKNQLKKNRYQIDMKKLKVFFELENTLNGMFAVFEELFNIKISSIEAPYKWIDDLRLYAVTDAASGAPLGLIYMDMFPREGKYNHFAQFGITPGKRMPDGNYQRPVVALICNFPPPANGKPSLLTYNDAETLFHEFGHALHSTLTQANYLEFSGTSVPRDFVEAPSQMLENWLRDKQILDRFAVDYRDGKSKIPSATLDKMEAARLATIGTKYRRQLGFGLLDLAIHMTTDEKVFDDFVAVTNKIMSDTYVPVPENTAFVASFGHLGGGYDAGYYGYAWADAISADMASVFRKAPGGLMDKKVGMRLRNEIYAKGGSREITDSIHAFLQRDSSLEPFFAFIGLKK